MKRTALLAVCTIAATANAAQWHYLSGGKLSGISSVGSHVWAIGQDGLFFYSEDNGDRWRRVARFTTRNLVDVEFWDQGFGLITAEGDIIYRTTDNGGTWDSSYVQYGAGHIRFVTRDCIWITSDSGGRILRSLDAGLSWPLGRSSRYGSWFLDSLNGWANGSGTDVMRTTNAGLDWSRIGKVPTPERGSEIRCFGFAPGYGVCAWTSATPGREPQLSRGWSVTFNSGADWATLTQFAAPGVVCDINAVCVIFGLEAHACIAYGYARNTRWSATSFQAFLDVSAARGERAWICGDGGAIWSSSDTGRTWSPARPQSGALLLNVSFCDSLHGWGASRNWTARTTDGGRAWTPAASRIDIGRMSDVIALDETTSVVAASWSKWDMWTGWVGSFGLGRTTNGGATWDTTHLYRFEGGDGPLGSSRFARVGQRIWHPGVLMPNGNSLRSTDDGSTWFDMDTLGVYAADREPPDVSFVDTLNGWAIDARANIRRTTNGGDSWGIIASVPTAKRLEMTSLTNGWAISDSGVFRTTDGGVTWGSVLIQSGLQAMSFCDQRHGAIVGLDGLLLRTEDAGQTWLRDSSEFTSDLYSVFMLDSAHVWAAGENGLVLGFGQWAIGMRDEPRVLQSPARIRCITPSLCRDRAVVQLESATAGAALILHDAAGRVRAEWRVPAGQRSLPVDLRSLSPGVYFIREEGVESSGNAAVRKVVITR